MTRRALLNRARSAYMFGVRYRWVRVGHDVHCKTDVSFWSPHRDIVIGDHVGIGPRCVFLADTRIGSKVLIAPEVAFLNSDDHRHDIVGRTMWDSGRGDSGRIVVGDDVWIGHGAIIMTPATIGTGSIVAAGSVVIHDVPPYAIVGGVPARVLRMRFDPEQIVEHERIIAQEQDQP